MPLKLDFSRHTLLDLIRSYHEASFRGVTVELMEQTRQNSSTKKQNKENLGSKSESREFYTFIPTLSQLYLVRKQQRNAAAAFGSSSDRSTENVSAASNQAAKKCSYIEYVEMAKPYHRLPLSKQMLEVSKELLSLPLANSSKKHTQIERVLEDYIRKGLYEDDASRSSSISSDEAYTKKDEKDDEESD